MAALHGGVILQYIQDMLTIEGAVTNVNNQMIKLHVVKHAGDLLLLICINHCKWYATV